MSITRHSIMTQCRGPTGEWSDLRNISAIKSVPKPAQIAQIARLSGILFDFLAKIRDVIVHHPIGSKRVGRPCAFEQTFTAQHAASGPDKDIQQFELDRRQLNWLAVLSQLAAREIHFDVA